MGTHKASYHELLPALRWGCSLGHHPGPEDNEDSSGVPVPVTAGAQTPWAADLCTVAWAAWVLQGN